MRTHFSSLAVIQTPPLNEKKREEGNTMEKVTFSLDVYLW